MKPSVILKDKKKLKIFQVISHLNNRFLELYLPNQDISTDALESYLSNSTCLSRHPNLELKLMSCVTLP
jgi:hypothetical protein